MTARDYVLQSAKRRYTRSNVIPDACIRSLQLSEWREWKFRPFDSEGKTNEEKLRLQDAALIQLCLCDVPAEANGEIEKASQSFLPEDVGQIACMDSGLANRLMKEIEDHLGIADDVEDAKKNLEMTPSDSSDTN